MPRSMHIDVTALLEHIDGHSNVCCMGVCDHLPDSARIGFLVV